MSQIGPNFQPESFQVRNPFSGGPPPTGNGWMAPNPQVLQSFFQALSQLFALWGQFGGQPQPTPFPYPPIPEVIAEAPPPIFEAPPRPIPEVIFEAPPRPIPEVIYEAPPRPIPEVIYEAPPRPIPEVIFEAPPRPIPEV
ncbi:MAG: hypothetical protein AB7S38_38215, partial [Vulcanimicrobiota bacterium]